MITNYTHFSSNNIHVFHKGSAKISAPPPLFKLPQFTEHLD